MLKLNLRHEATGTVLEFEPPKDSNYPSDRSKTRIIEWDIRDATMQLIDKVAVNKNVAPMEVLSTPSAITMVAIWDVGASD